MRQFPAYMAVALLAAGLGAAAEEIKPGLWQISLESRVAATPDWNPEPFQQTQCLTEHDAQNPDQFLSGMATAGASGCDFLNRQASANHLGFDVSCGGTLGIKGHGEVDFTAITLEGILNISFVADAGTAEVTEMQNKIRAVYLGACPSGGGLK